MGNSIIICEGATDGVLLQYFMEKVNGWEYFSKESPIVHRRPGLKKDSEWACVMKHDVKRDRLVIQSAGTCSELLPVFEEVMGKNSLAGNSDERFEKVVVFTDHDEMDSDMTFPKEIQDFLSKKNVRFSGDVTNNQWKECSMTNKMGEQIVFKVLVMVVPFEEEGALETFLLNALSEMDSYDKAIIDKGNQFVETVDPERKYLTQRRYVTKAKFDVYFSVRTAADQFTERQKILKNIPWENYPKLRRDFSLLGEL